MAKRISHTHGESIKHFNCKTKLGNDLHFLYNPENDLIVIDLVHESGLGGSEIVREVLNEKSLLKHMDKESTNG